VEEGGGCGSSPEAADALPGKIVAHKANALNKVAQAMVLKSVSLVPGAFLDSGAPSLHRCGRMRLVITKGQYPGPVFPQCRARATACDY
jgi:hypothetical protein